MKRSITFHGDNGIESFDCPEEEYILDAAEDAAATADAIENGDDCGRKLNESAEAALTAALERLSQPDAGGNGVAAQVLQV